MSDSNSSSSSDDDVFTEPVHLRKKALRRRTLIHTATTSSSLASTAESSIKTDVPSPTVRDAQTPLTGATAESKFASSAAPLIAVADDGNNAVSKYRKDNDGHTTTVELSVAALQTMSGSTFPVTHQSASTNTEASSSHPGLSIEMRHKVRRGRRLVGGARPPLHKRTLTAATATLGNDNSSSLYRPVSTPSPNSEKDARDTQDAMLRRSHMHSTRAGDMVTASSMISASNEMQHVSLLRANSTITSEASVPGRSRPHSQHRCLHTVCSSSSMSNNFPHTSGHTAQVAPHLLSDEAYLDAFKIPALIAQLSLSLIAAKPADMRSFARDWLADRLVSEEDEEDDPQGNGSTVADFVNSSCVAATAAALSPERGSTCSYGIGASTSMSDAASIHGSNRNVDAGSLNTNSFQASTRGVVSPAETITTAAAAAASSRKRSPRSNTSSAISAMCGDGREEDGDEEDEVKPYDLHRKLEDSPPLILVTSPKQEVATASREKEGRKNSFQTKTGTGGKIKKRQRKNIDQLSSGGGTTRVLGKYKGVRRTTRPPRNMESLSRSELSSSPAPTPTKAKHTRSVVHGSPGVSPPNRSIMKTLPPVDTSKMTDEEKVERSKILADMAEAAFLHAAEQKKEKEEGKSISASSSSNSFFDTTTGKGWAHADLPTPVASNVNASPVSRKGDDGTHETNLSSDKKKTQHQRDRNSGSFPLPLPVQDSGEPDPKGTKVDNLASLTEDIQRGGGGGGDNMSLNTANTLHWDPCAALLGQQATSNPSERTTTAATAQGTNAQPRSATAAASAPSTHFPESDARTPPSSNFQTPRSTIAEQSGSAGNKKEHVSFVDSPSKDDENSKTKKISISSSNAGEGDDNTSFALFAPLLAVDRRTNEVIDYRTSAGNAVSQASYLGGPPLNIPTGSVTRIPTPAVQGAPPGYLVSSLSVTNTSVGTTSANNLANLSACTGGNTPYMSSQANPSAQFPPYSSRTSTGTFNLLPTPMLADMVGGSGLTNTSFGRRSGAASVAAASALARHGEHVMMPSTASLTSQPFLTPHESGDHGMTSDWKSMQNLQLPDLPSLGLHGVNSMSTASKLVSGVASGSGAGLAGVNDSLPRSSACSLAASVSATSQGAEVRADALLAELPTPCYQASLMHGKAEDEEASAMHYNSSHSDADAASASRPDAAVSLGSGAGSLTSSMSTTVKADSARRLGKLMSQLPPSRYAAAIVFLEGLMSSSTNCDTVDASGGDVISTTTPVVVPYPHNTERFTTSDPLLAEPGSVSMGLSGKVLSPVTNIDVSTRAWPVPPHPQSSPLGSLPTTHGVPSFSEIVGTSHAMSSDTGIDDSLHGAEMMDPTKKSSATLKPSGSASVNAIVRDALSQSVLCTLPPIHSSVENLSAASRQGSSTASRPGMTSAVALTNEFTLGTTKDHMAAKTLNLSSVRLDAKGEVNNRRLLANTSMNSTNSIASTAGTNAAVAAVGIGGGNPTNLKINASARSLPGVPSFYKKPSGNDLSSLCPNPSTEEVTSGSSVSPDAQNMLHPALGNSSGSATKTDPLSSRDRKGAPRRPDLKAVPVPFTSALISDEAYNLSDTDITPQIPLSPLVASEEQSPTSSQLMSDPNITPVSTSTTTTTPTMTPEKGHVKPSTGHAAGAVPTTHVSVTTTANTAPTAEAEEKEEEEDKAFTSSSSDAKDMPDTSPDRKPESPFDVPHWSTMQDLPSNNEPQDASAHPPLAEQVKFSKPECAPEEHIRSLPSLLDRETKLADRKQTAFRIQKNDSASSSESTATTSHNRVVEAKGSAALPAGSELPHSKPDEPNADDKKQEFSLRPDHGFVPSTFEGPPHQELLSREATTEAVVPVSTTGPQLPLDAFQHPATAHSTHSTTRGSRDYDTNSDGSQPARNGPKLRRRKSKLKAHSHDSKGSWLESLAHVDASAGETRSPTSRRLSHWHSPPSFLQEAHAFSTPQGGTTNNSHVAFAVSPPQPSLPESAFTASKDATPSMTDMEAPSESAKRFDDDSDFGATLRTAVVMAATTGSCNPPHSSPGKIGSPFGTFTTHSSSKRPESFASELFSPPGAVDSYHVGLGTSSSSFSPATPQNLGYTSAAGTGTAVTSARPPRLQEPHASAMSPRTISSPGTNTTSSAANGGNAGPSSVAANAGSESTADGAALMSPITQLSLPLSHSSARDPLVTSSVAAAMNSFLSREGHVAPEEVEIVRDAVGRFDAFAALDETQIETLVRTMSRVRLSQGETLVREGEPTLEKLLLVVSGKLSISRKGLVTRSFTRGQFYGEMEMSYHVERSRVTLTAAAPTIVYTLSKVDYQKLVIHEKDARRYMFLQYVNQCDLFKGLSPPTKMRLADSFRVCRLRKGTKLTEQGAPVQWMYLLMSGTVRMNCKPLAQSIVVPPMVDRSSLLRRATTTDGDITARAAITPHSTAELLSCTPNLYDPAAPANTSPTMQGPRTFLRFATTASSQPLTPFRRHSALTQTPKGKPGTGVQELLQLAESKVFSAEMRKSSCSISVSPLHTPGLQPGISQPFLSNSNREDNNSGSINRNARFLSSGDALEDTLVQTPMLGKTTSSSQSEDRSRATKENSTPQLRRRRLTEHQPDKHSHGHQRHFNPNVLNTPVLFRAEAPPSVGQLGSPSLGSTMESLDPATLQRCTSPSPSNASGNAKHSIGSFNVSGNPRLAKAAFGCSVDSSGRPEDAVVVVDRSRGQLVNEPEFVFKCKGLFTAVATTPVQAARISRLHFEAIMNRKVIDELKRSMLLNPDYYYFESTVPEELKQEMRQMLFRLNVGARAKRHSHFALPPSRRRASRRCGSNEKSVSQSVTMMDSSLADANTGLKHLWTRQPSSEVSPMLAAHTLRRYTSKELLMQPSSPTANSASKGRFRTVKVRCDGTGGSNAGGDEEVSSVRSTNGTRLSGHPQRQRSRLYRTAPLESSPTPDPDSRGSTSFPAENADAATAAADLSVNGNATGSSCQFLEAPAVSNNAAHGSPSSVTDMFPAIGDEVSVHTGAGRSGGAGKGSGGGVNMLIAAGRSRTGPRRDTVDNLTISPKHSSTAGSHSRRISARGEIVFSGSRNLYRFTADAMSLNQSIVIAVVVDGTIIRWNSVAQSVTGYAPFETIGKSIYDFITSEEGRQQMRDVLSLATHYAGKWEQYSEQNLQENRVFPFRQNTGLYQVGLALSVVPSNCAKTAEVLLLVGREGKYRAADTYASDVARWLEGLLKPQLRQFQRRMMQIESHGWRVTAEDALQVKGNLDACLSMVEQFTKFSLLNMEAVNESWRPVRLPALLSRFAVEASSFARQRRHEYYCNIEQVEPKTEIFFDAPQMLAILRLLLADAFMSPNEDEDGNPIIVHAELRVTVVEPQDTHAGPGGSNVSGSVSVPARMTASNLGMASPATSAAPGASISTGGAKTSPAPLFGAVSGRMPSHPSNNALVMLADQLSLHPHGTSHADPILRIASLHQQHQPLHSHEEEASRAAGSAGPHGRSKAAFTPKPQAAGGGAMAEDGSGGDTPSASAGNTGATAAAGTPPSVGPTATARRAMPITASNAPAGRAATTSCASIIGASSPSSGKSNSLSASLRRIRFELRDDGPTIPSLCSPETVASGSVRVAVSPNSSGPTRGSNPQPPPNTASPPGECITNEATSLKLDCSQANEGSPRTAKPTRGAELQQVEKILSNLGGLVYGFTRPEAAGNVVRVELPLLAVPGASEEGREDENGLTAGGGAPFSGGNRTFTVIVADNNRAHQQHMCQILWTRQHAVVPVSSYRDLVRKLEMNTTDILLIDPLQLDVMTEDYESLVGEDPFDEIRILSARLALVVMTSDFSDWRVQTLLNRQAVVELPKVGSGALVHIAMQEAEQLVTEMRDEEERIDLIRRTFTNCSAERHKIGKRIGKGAFGDVYEVEDTLTGGKMAMKCMRLHDGLLADEVVQEILAMTTLKHENIIQYFYCEKESDTLLRLYMELAPGGTLRDKIREHPGVSLPFEDIVHHLSDICRGLAYIHEQRYVHGDLKTANLLLGTRGRTKIGDFGTVKRLAPHQLLYTMVGTPQYMAPEVLTADVEERLGYDFKADIWSLGCIVLEMATGNAPFAHLDCAQGMGIIKYLTELTDTPDLSPLFSGNPLVYEFVKSCLDIDPKNRPTAQELLHFDILEGAVASQRAERLVKRAEMLYKLNKYAAMRADGGGSRNLAGDGGGSIDSGHSDRNGGAGSELFYSEDDSNTTEDYEYYDEEDEGDLSEDTSNVFDGIDDVSALDVDEEEGEYTDEEYEFSSSSSSGSSGSDAYKRERHAVDHNAKDSKEDMEQLASPVEQFQSQTTLTWQSSRGQAVSPTDLMRTPQPKPPVQSPVTPPLDTADAPRPVAPSALEKPEMRTLHKEATPSASEEESPQVVETLDS